MLIWRIYSFVIVWVSFGFRTCVHSPSGHGWSPKHILAFLWNDSLLYILPRRWGSSTLWPCPCFCFLSSIVPLESLWLSGGSLRPEELFTIIAKQNPDLRLVKFRAGTLLRSVFGISLDLGSQEDLCPMLSFNAFVIFLCFIWLGFHTLWSCWICT